MRARLFILGLAAAALAACRLPGESGGGIACADSARLDMPVDLSVYAQRGSLWPHGVHGGPHPEGHPGIDFLIDTSAGDIVVTAPLTSEIVAVQAESTVAGNSCIVLDSACVQVNFCHLRLDAGLGQGSKLKRGQRVGTVGRLDASGPLSLHFGTYLGVNADQVCPADLLDPDSVRCKLGSALDDSTPADCGSTSTRTLMSRSVYPESAPHRITVACLDGTSQDFDIPAETRLCNPRLDAAARQRMETCLGPACAGVW